MACAGITSSGGTRLTNWHWPAVEGSFCQCWSIFVSCCSHFRPSELIALIKKKIVESCKICKAFPDISFVNIGFCSFLCWWLTFFLAPVLFLCTMTFDSVKLLPLTLESQASAWVTEASTRCWLLWVYCVGEFLIKPYYDNGATYMWISLEV